MVNRAGKSGGTHKMWMNVQMLPKGEIVSVNFDVVEWKPKEETVMMTNNWDPQLAEAKAIELKNLEDNLVYEEADDVGQEYIDTKWHITEKTTEDGQVVKARLVAKGFQEDTENIRTDSPTCAKGNLRTILAISAGNKWKVKSVDIKSAFLQGRDIQREVYVKPPKEVPGDKLWKLKKALYGLNDAAREWYLKVREAVNSMAGERSALDNAVFFWRKHESLIGICACHVDDFIISGSDEFLDQTIAEIKTRFKVSSECEGMFKYIGLEIEQNNDGIQISQTGYSNDLSQMQSNSDDSYSDAPLNAEQKRNLKSIAGQLLWISSHSRPDISYDVCEVSTSVKDATEREIFTVNKIIRKLKSDEVKILYPQIGNIDSAELVVFTDASYRNLKDNGSQGGHIIFLKGANGN